MLVQKVNTISYSYNKPAFRSNREHSLILKALEAKVTKLEELQNYQIQDKGCHDMAQFLLNFVCAIENDSEHSLDEFFKSEVEAARLRQGLSPECQKNSLEIRNAIQSQPVFKDPALTLITAKDMKDFVPADEEFAQDEMYQATINAAKKTIVNVVETADKSKFDTAEIGMMKELTQIIEKTKGLDFGSEYDKTLEKLLNSIKNRKQQIEKAAVEQKKSFIPKLKFKLKF